MLALLARVTGLTGAGIVVDLVDALAVVSARSGRAFVGVGLAGCTSPSWMTDALVAEELIHADSVQARIPRAEIDFLMAAFAGKSGRAVAREIGDQIGAVGAKQARSLGTIVSIDLTALTFPSW